MTGRYSDQGIILSKKDFSEADRILVLFSKKNGRVSLMAKGVKKLKSRKRGHLEVFNEIKFSASETKGMDIVTDVEKIDNLEFKTLNKISLAYYFVEIVNKVSQEGEKNEELYSLLLNYLNRLQTTNKLQKLRQEFVHKLLMILGFWPRRKRINNPDVVLSEVLEKEISSLRVGKKLLV